MKTINSNTEMKTNTHISNLTTIPARPQAPNALCPGILLGIDQHAADLRVVRQPDGAAAWPEPAWPGQRRQCMPGMTEGPTPDFLLSLATASSGPLP